MSRATLLIVSFARNIRDLIGRAFNFGFHALEAHVPHVGAAHQVNHQFRDIARVVADPFRERNTQMMFKTREIERGSSIM